MSKRNKVTKNKPVAARKGYSMTTKRIGKVK